MSVESAEQHAVRLVIAPDRCALGRIAAGIVSETLRASPEAAISLTTGHTTTGLFDALIDEHRAGRLDLTRARLIHSEEYAGVAAADPISLIGWLCRALLVPCGIGAASVERLSGEAPDLDAECRRFDGVLAGLGALALVVQSVGANGHFGFNEPGATPDAPSRVVTLAPSTWAVNAAYWTDGARVPRRGLTMGVAPTIGARHVLLLASGAAKAEALARALEGPIDSAVPCSLLRLAPRLTVVADAAAAEALGITARSLAQDESRRQTSSAAPRPGAVW